MNARDFIKKLNKEYGIDALVFFYGGFAILNIILGSMLLNMKTPNLQVGYPTMAIGFAFFVFAFNHHSSIVSAMKTEEILKRLIEIQEKLNQNEN